MMIALAGGISLRIREPDKEKQSYSSCRIQKGLLLFQGKKDLSEEGIGFGVPILKFGEKTIFPGRGYIEFKEHADSTHVMIDYDLNLAETIAIKGRKIENRTIYSIKESLSRLHRKYPFSRKLLTESSNALRRWLDIETGFEEVASLGLAGMKYTITTDGMINVRADLSRINKEGCTRIMIMNEQGANFFDTYYDSKGTILPGDAIGSWQETSCDKVSFIHSIYDMAFTLSKIDGSKMFYGRELVGNRLSWAGIAYSISPHMQDFAYDIRLGMKR